MKKKLKDEQFRDYIITIDRIREVYALGKRDREYKDKMFLITIKNSCGSEMEFSVKIGSHYGKSLRKVLKKIQEGLHLI